MPFDDIPLENFSYAFINMGPVQSSGAIDYPGIGRISWTPGTRPENIFTIGMLSETFGFKALSIDKISEVTGYPYYDAPLSEFTPITKLSVSELVAIVPGLGNLRLSQAPPIQRMAELQGIVGDRLIGEVAPYLYGILGDLGSELIQFGISSIPGLSGISLGSIPGIDIATIADIPGLSNFPLINPLSIKDWFVPFDIGFGMSPCKMGWDCHERNIDNTASGNWKNMAIPCMGAKQSCAHIEVRRNIGLKDKNIRWVSKEHKVPGGNGFLCKWEPTGRFPLGKNPKVVLENIDEAEGKITFALYFAVYGPFGAESAHCFGPFPMPFFGSAKEGQWILFGPDRIPTNSPFAGLGGSLPPAPGAPSGGGGSDVVPVDCKGDTNSNFIRPTSGPITSGFGWRTHPISGEQRFHAGVDFGDPHGTPIHASNCGTVVLADWVGGYGNYTCISHGNGFKTCYGHQSQIIVRGGQSVKKGEVIGYVGSTGNSTGPHLHFEVRINGSPVDPMGYVR
jgi:hypothetical protein